MEDQQPGLKPNQHSDAGGWRHKCPCNPLNHSKGPSKAYYEHHMATAAPPDGVNADELGLGAQMLEATNSKGVLEERPALASLLQGQLLSMTCPSHVWWFNSQLLAGRKRLSGHRIAEGR